MKITSTSNIYLLVNLNRLTLDLHAVETQP